MNCFLELNPETPPSQLLHLNYIKFNLLSFQDSDHWYKTCIYIDHHIATFIKNRNDEMDQINSSSSLRGFPEVTEAAHRLERDAQTIIEKMLNESSNNNSLITDQKYGTFG